MDVIDQGARVGTVGFVLGRLILEPPSMAVSEKFGDATMRTTWPLQDPLSTAALETVSGDMYMDHPRDHTALFGGKSPRVELHESTWREDIDDPAGLRAELIAVYEWADLKPLPKDDNVGHQIALLGSLAARTGRAAAEGETAQMDAAAQGTQDFRIQHLDRVIDPILEAIALHAGTRLYRALPDLVRGFLNEQAALCDEVLNEYVAT